MKLHMERNVVNYATMVIEWLDLLAHDQGVARPPLVELFIDTLQALEQNKEQED